MMPNQKIKRKRKERGYSQDLLGITSSAYSKIERGETRIDVERLKQIAEALKTDVIDFFEDDTMVVTYNTDHATGNNGVAIQPSYEASTESWKQMVMHLEGEVTVLRQEKDRLLCLVERLTVKSE